VDVASGRSLRIGVLLILVGSAVAASPSVGGEPSAAADGFHVLGRHLYDRCGELVVLRGVNKMIIWTDIDGVPSCAAIARTGANAVRMVWLTDGSAAELDEAIGNCVAAGLIPMVELHDGIGDWSLLPALVDWWTRPDVLDVIDRHHRYLLINIGNEVGDATVTPEMFRTGYRTAVQRMRDAGIHVPLVIDGTDWGKDIDVLQAEGPALIAADPDHNLIFSVHMWWPRMWGYTEQRVIDELEQSAAMGLPLIVGEFGNQWNETAAGAIPYLTILEHTHRLGIGMLPWEWGPGNNPQTWLDMTADGAYDTLFGWGLEVSVTDPFSIANTAVRPDSMVTGRCRSAVTRPGGGRRVPAP
jgi:mannan endo-1,4-beta-mannosidase